jgi:hypothetical protein
MGVVIVRYRVKPGQEERNAELVRAVCAELSELDPGGFSYATFRQEDGRTFVHIAVTEGEEPAPLSEFAAFREFKRELPDRCEWGPERSPAGVVGSYGLLE